MTAFARRKNHERIYLMKKIPLTVICGPTASGKTALAIKKAQEQNGEIVNADSMQIYKYMNIGTAKPTGEELSLATHHLIDIVDPKDSFSVADYVVLAHKKIEEIHESGKTPILAGGTGLYINSVVDDVEFGDEGCDLQLRTELNALAQSKGIEAVIDILKEFDPVSAERLHRNNARRIIRAVEFYKTTGKPISVHQEETKQKISRYEPQMYMINYDREVLYDRINRRVHIMIEQGLLTKCNDCLIWAVRLICSLCRASDTRKRLSI